MKRLVLASIFYFASQIAAFAQGGRYDTVVFGPNGQPKGGVSITACTSAGTGTPCTPLAPIFSDAALTQQIANSVVTTDGLGNAGFYIAPGLYKYSITGAGVTPALFTFSVACVPGTQAATCGASLGSAVNFSSVASSAANPATSGFTRLASTDSHCWRNNGNTADLCLSKNASDQLLFNGSLIAVGGSVTSFSAGTLSPLFTTSVATPTTTPVLSFTLTNQNANFLFVGPSSGGAAPPTFRALVGGDIPVVNLASSGNGGVTGTLSAANGGTGTTTATGTGSVVLSAGPALTTPTIGGGSTITRLNIISTSVTCTQILANTALAEGPFTVSGIQAADKVLAAVWSSAQSGNFSYQAYRVTAVNTLVIDMANNSGVNVTPVCGSVTLVLFQ